MRTTALLACALSIGAFDTAFQATDSTHGNFVIEGGCNVTTESVSCWKPSGESDRALTERVRDFFTEGSREVEFAFKKKTRYVVVGWKADPNGEIVNPGMSIRTLMPLAKAGNQGFGGHPTEKPDKWLMVVNTDQSGKVPITIPYMVSKVVGDYKLMPEVGAKSGSGDAEIEVTKIDRVPREKMRSVFRMNNEFGWRIHLKSGTAPLSSVQQIPEYVTRDGKAFEVIDSQGTPLPGAPPEKSGALPNRAMAWLGGDVTGARWIDMNMDPAKTGPIQFKSSLSSEAKAQLGEMPIDPTGKASPLPATETKLRTWTGEEGTAATGETWEDAELGKFKIEGLFSVSPDSVKAWDIDRKADPMLAKMIEAELLKNPQYFGRFGYKSRYLVGRYANEPMGPSLSSVEASDGQVNLWNRHYRIDTKKDAKETDVILSIFVPGTAPVARVSTDPSVTSVPVLKTVKSSGGMLATAAMMDQNRPVWRLYLDVKNEELNHLAPIPSVQSGERVTWVDTEGKPITTPTAPRDKKPVIAMCMVGFDSQKKNWWLDTNIDPDQLKEIGFTKNGSKAIRFKSIPLEPSK